MDRKLLHARLSDQPKYREKQILDNIYEVGLKSWEEMQNLPKNLRESLSDIPILTVNPVNKVVSKDGTIKTLFKLSDGVLVEAVMIPNKEFRTVCVSSQVGCAMGCTFCATGTLGLTRNLTADEIIDQVLFYDGILENSDKNSSLRVSNVVFMGMGEPLLNLDNVLESVEVLNEELGIAARKISISTCGIIPGIKRIAEFPKQINLAISIHAPESDLRSQIMPVNKGFPLEKLMAACLDYVKKTKRKLMFEHVMLNGINDSDDHANKIAALLSKLKPLVVLNLIPFHQTFLNFSSASGNRIHEFQRIVKSHNIECLIRHSAGVDVDAACGQLARTAYDKSPL